MRGIAKITAVTIVAEVGRFSRFSYPTALMGYSGLVPSEHSSGGPDKAKRGAIMRACPPRFRAQRFAGHGEYTRSGTGCAFVASGSPAAGRDLQNSAYHDSSLERLLLMHCPRSAKKIPSVASSGLRG